MNIAAPDRSGEPADPFGLWSTVVAPPAVSPAAQPEGAASFALPAEDQAGEQEGTVWRLDLTSGPAGQAAAQQALDRRAGQVQRIFSGLEQAVPRSQALLNARAAAAGAGVSFAAESPAEALPGPEAWLAGTLEQISAAGTGADEVSFGLGQNLANLAGTIKQTLTGAPPEALPVPGWDEMQHNFTQLMDTVNRQLLHFCWVDTTLDGQLAARTSVDWGGDMLTLWKDGLMPEQAAIHRRSLELAMQSRAANIKTVLTVAEVAGKLTLAVTTPMGPLQAAQALVLGWKFVSSVVMPLLQQA